MDTKIQPWVAVVDDEASIRRALLRLLRAAGIPACGYDGGAALLAALRDDGAGDPYCVVLDLHMPDMSGFEVQQHLAEVAPRTGVIAVTGQHSPEIQARVQRGSALAYMLKPMNDLELLEAIAAARSGWK
jgi:FixJ family two-component response regulator